jgi:hypothetical protein
MADQGISKFARAIGRGVSVKSAQFEQQGGLQFVQAWAQLINQVQGLSWRPLPP